MGAARDRAPRRRWHRSTAAIVGLVAFGSSLVALLYTISPSLRPDPAQRLDGTLKVVRVERDATFDAYLARLSPAQRRRLRGANVVGQGFIVYLQVHVNGRKHEDIRLRQALYEVGGGRVEDRGSPAVFRPDTASDRWITPLYVSNPELGPGKRFTVRYELYDDDALLSIVDTPRLPASSE